MKHFFKRENEFFLIGQALHFQITPLLGVLVGVAVTLVLIVIGVAGVVHYRQKRKRQQLQHQAQQHKNATSSNPSSSTLNRSSALYAAYATQQGNGNSAIGNGQTQHSRKPISSSSHSFQKDPDIILTDMGILFFTLLDHNRLLRILKFEKWNKIIFSYFDINRCMQMYAPYHNWWWNRLTLF